MATGVSGGTLRVLKGYRLMRQPLRTIVVEDDPILAEDLAQTLRDLGHEVCGIAHKVSELGALLEANAIDLITLDLNLGRGHEGLGVATALQAGGFLPVVFVTGMADDEQKEEILSTGAASLVIKPYTPEELEMAIALAMSRAEQAASG